jgi:hypothetical protein
VANPTTNYGFVLPTPTDLVTDLPADFDVALQGVDTRLKALQPGTTLGDLVYSSATANTNTRLGIGTSGQVLAVSGGGVPAWTTTADVTPLTTKGDLFTFTTVDARLGVGTNGQVLVADSAEATGLKWATAAAGGSWTSYTPTLTGWTLGNGTLVGFYNNDGKTVNVAASVKWGSTTSASGNLYLSLPVAADLTLGGTLLFNIYQAGGVGVATDNSADTYYAIGSYVTGTTTMRIIATNGANNSGVAVSIPFTWATNDMMIISITYKAA